MTDATPRTLALVRTGFEDLDRHIGGGFAPGSLTVIASRPGMGRTTLLSDICRFNAIRRETPTALWTLEEEAADVTTRILSCEARVALNHIHADLLDDAALKRMGEAGARIKSAPLLIAAPAQATVADIAKEAASVVADQGVALLAIDGIQDIRPEKRNDLREREVGDVVRDLKTLARTLQVPIVATSHLNRSPEQRMDKRPKLDDLRESGAITFAADLIVMIHREDYYDRESPRAGEADLIVVKNRRGSNFTATVAFQGHYGRFVEMAIH